MIYSIPSQYEGKTLKQIAQEISQAGGYVANVPLIAKAFGVSEDTPLRTGMYIDTSSAQPFATDSGSGEIKFLQANFKETTKDALFAEEFVKTQEASINEETKWVNEYIADNPFVFDEALAKQSSTVEYQPYYTELLQDYLTDVGQKRETTQDEQKLLRQLRQLDVGTRSRAYDYAVEQAELGAAGRGVFSSGMRARDVGRKEIEYKTGLEGATGRYETGEAGLERQLTGYDIEQQRQERDIGRKAETAIAGGILQREEEAYKGYNMPLLTAYQRRFPTSTGGVEQYLPPEYLRY